MPNTIHRIWLGGKMPDRYKQYGELWKELNPDYILWDWTEEEVFDSEWTNRDVLHDMYNNSKKPGADLIAYYTHVADVIDYDILYRFGGWYFNTDIKPIKSLEGTQKVWPALAMEDDIHPVNMAMFSPESGNEFFNLVNRLLGPRYFSMPGAFMNASTGVQLLQEAVSKYWGHIYYYDRNVFNPIHWAEFNYGEYPDTEREYPEETIAVHEWLHRTNQRGQRVVET